MSSALLAALYGRCLVIRSPQLRAAFDIPPWVRHDFPPGKVEKIPGGVRASMLTRLLKMPSQVETRWWHQHTLERRLTQANNVSHIQRAMQIMGRRLFGQPAAAVKETIDRLMLRHQLVRHRLVVVHLRTFAELTCSGGFELNDCGQCIATRSMACIAQFLRNRRAIVFTDAPRFASQHVVRSFDMTETAFFGKNTSMRLERSNSATIDSAVIWHMLRGGTSRIVTGISTFSKSALLCSNVQTTRDLIVDLRCRKTWPSDGDLFSCKAARARPRMSRDGIPKVPTTIFLPRRPLGVQ